MISKSKQTVFSTHQYFYHQKYRKGGYIDSEDHQYNQIYQKNQYYYYPSLIPKKLKTYTSHKLHKKDKYDNYTKGVSRIFEDRRKINQVWQTQQYYYYPSPIPSKNLKTYPSHKLHKKDKYDNNYRKGISRIFEDRRKINQDWQTQQYYYYPSSIPSKNLKINPPHKLQKKQQLKHQYYDEKSKQNKSAIPIVEYGNQKPLTQITIQIISNPLVLANNEIIIKGLENQSSSILKNNFTQQNQQAKIEKKKIERQKNLIRIRMQQNNKRKYWVQVTRMFLKIKPQNVYDIQLVKISQVWQNYKNNKFEIAVVKGYLKKQKQNKLLKTFLIAYKVNRFQQLIRMENTYQTIFGIITYPKYFPIENYLKQISRKNFAAKNIVVNEQKDQKTQIENDSEIENDTMSEKSMID